MQKYELTLVLPEKATAAKKKSVAKLLEKLVKTYEGKLGKVEEWGKKDLYHEIEGETTGVFLNYPIQLESDKVNPLQENLKMENDIIRFLIVKVEEETGSKE